MAFGLYIHIPYCLQRCPYCDFATYEQGQILGPDLYVDLLCQEITQRHLEVGPRSVDTLYFGGGTPSLLEPNLLGKIIDQFRRNGFSFLPNSEMTMEINPATLTPQRLKEYQDLGLNRFSIGAQSFNSEHLRRLGRKHTAEDTRKTIEILKDAKANFNADLLFALPHQSLSDLDQDLEEFLRHRPNHISPYCLTVPESNPLSSHRPEDPQQVQMFERVREQLTQAGYEAYEISNYALSGHESRHNLLYWNDDEYWGVGLSSHSFLKSSKWGTRFWNPRAIRDYELQIRDAAPLPRQEVLKEHEALTDFCHTALRTAKGLVWRQFDEKFPGRRLQVENAFQRTHLLGWTEPTAEGFRLTWNGQLLSNRVFQEFLFMPEDLSPASAVDDVRQGPIISKDQRG